MCKSAELINRRCKNRLLDSILTLLGFILHYCLKKIIRFHAKYSYKKTNLIQSEKKIMTRINPYQNSPSSAE